MSKVIKRTVEDNQAFIPMKFDASEGAPSEIHVVPFGNWNHHTAGDLTMGEPEMREMIANFNGGAMNEDGQIAITAGHDKPGEESEAIGWFTDLYMKADGLWASVDWTPKGKNLLANRSFKYFSPEMSFNMEDQATGEIYDVVLTGGALTNSPFFRELSSVVFHSVINSSNSNSSMDREELLKKDESELTDEERKFLEESAPEEEQEEEAPEADESDEEESAEEDDEEEEVEASNNGMVTISASRLKSLESKADQGAEANRQLKQTNFSNEVQGHVFSKDGGSILPKSKDVAVNLMMSMDDEQLEQFRTFMSQLPEADMFSKEGHGKTVGDENDKASDKIEKKIQAARKDDDSLSYSQALTNVLDANPELAAEHEKQFAN